MTGRQSKLVSLLAFHMVSVCLLLAVPALGAPIKWKAAVDGNWDNSNRWDPMQVPGTNDDASNPFVVEIKHRTPPGEQNYDTTVNSFTTKGIFTLQGGSFAATNNVILDGAGTFQMTGGTLKNTKVVYANAQADGAFGLVGGTLDGVTLQTNVSFPSGQNATVKNGLRLDDTKQVTIDKGSILNFDGTQTLSKGRVQIASGVIGLSPGTELKIDGTGFRFPNQANAILGQRSPNQQNPTQVTISEASVFSWTGGLFPRGTLVISPDRFVNQGAVDFSLMGELGVSFNTREFVNDARARGFTGTLRLDKSAIVTDSLLNRGEYTVSGLNGTSTVTTDSFINKGVAGGLPSKFVVTSNGDLTVSGGTGLQQATNAGELTIQKGGKLNFRTSLLQEEGATTVNGNLEVQRGIFLGGSVKGTGRIVGNVSMAGGTFRPGNSSGLMSIIGAYGQSTTGSLEIESGGETFDFLSDRFEYDRLAIDGPASLGGLLAVTLIGGFTPDNDDLFTILTATGSLSGVFDNAVPASPFAPAFLAVGMGMFEVHYNRSLGGFSTVTLSNFRAVPEPSALSLLAIGTLGVLGYGWRRRSTRTAGLRLGVIA